MVLRLTWLPLGLAVAATVQLFGSLNAAVGRVELQADAVSVRRLAGVATVGVNDVRRFLVPTTSFGRHVRLQRYLNRTLRLPAPVSPILATDDRFDEQVETIGRWCRSRFGGGAGPTAVGRRPRWAYPVVVLSLVVGVALPDRPWDWVAGAEASDIPEPCVAVQSEAAALVGPVAGESVATVAGELAVSLAPELQVTGCRWIASVDRILFVVMNRYARSGLYSGRSVAESHVLAGGPGALAWSTGLLLKPLPPGSRLGDASLAAYLEPLGGYVGPIGAVVAVRRANVIVETYLGPSIDIAARYGGASDIAAQAPPTLGEPDVAGLLAVVRAALASIEVH